MAKRKPSFPYLSCPDYRDAVRRSGLPIHVSGRLGGVSKFWLPPT